MAGVAEKARFYVERAVPQLREWEEKEIFGKDEIRTIVQKRNEHEHRVLSPGNKPSQWSSYAKWELSLESLRTKRCKRLKIRQLESAHTGQVRVLSIYERGVNRHLASGALWREYLAYAASIKAAKRWRKTMTKALRVNPTDPELWMMAGRRSARNGDMAASRGFFMRGCRFCTKDCTLWVEYARSEMEWLDKVEKRKAKPGADALKPDKTGEDDVMRLIDSDEDEDEDEDGLLLPDPDRTQAPVIDKQAAQQLTSNPAMDGAIPMAIFDISSKQAFFDAESAESFFEMLGSFRGLSVYSRISEHILAHMDENYSGTASTASCHIRRPIIGLSSQTAEFPRNLREVLSRLKTHLQATAEKEELQEKTQRWIDGYLADENLDQGIRTVLEHTKRSLQGESA